MSTEDQQGKGARAISAVAHYTRGVGRRLFAPGRLSETQRNERLLYADIAFQSIANGGAMAFVAVFLVRIGAPSWVVGAYTSLPALAMTLSILPAGAWLQRRRDLLQTTNWARMAFRAVVAAFALLPFLPLGVAPYVLLALRTLMAVPQSIMNVGVTTVLGMVTTPQRRMGVLSIRMAVSRMGMALSGLAAGFWLDNAAYPLNYQILFASCLVVAIGSFATFGRIRPPADAMPPAPSQHRVGLRQMVRLIQSEPPFRRFVLASLLFRLGMGLPVALFPIFRVRTLGASDSWIGVIFTVQRLIQMVAFVALSRLLTKRKYRRWLWVSNIVTALFPFTTALASTPQMLLIPAVIAGLSMPGMNVFLSDTLLRTSPEDQRPMFAAINTFVAQVCQFIGPLLGTLLSENIGIRYALVAAALVRASGAIAFRLLRVRGEPSR